MENMAIFSFWVAKNKPNSKFTLSAVEWANFSHSDHLKGGMSRKPHLKMKDKEKQQEKNYKKV
jgi:hypothetical protein